MDEKNIEKKDNFIVKGLLKGMTTKLKDMV